MNEKRKDELGRRFLLSPYILIDECNELEIQELIFLIHSSKHLKTKEAAPAKQLDERISLLINVLHEKVRDAEALYIAYEKKTNYPYIDAEDRIWMFSTEEYASHAADYFMQQQLMLEMKRVNKEDLMKMFGELHMLGLQKILVDNGQYHTLLDRDELLPPPDFGDTPEINIPVTNPDLQHAIIRFFQFIGTRRSGEGAKQLAKEFEAKMLYEVIRAKYLVPMQLEEKVPSTPDEQGRKTIKEGARIQFAVLGGEGDSKWLPVFTDWKEFEKAYDKKVWSSNIATYDDIVAISARMNGIVVNCRGIPIPIHEKNKQMIEAYRQELASASAEASKEAPTEAVQESNTDDVPTEATSDAPDRTSDAVPNEVSRQALNDASADAPIKAATDVTMDPATGAQNDSQADRETENTTNIGAQNESAAPVETKHSPSAAAIEEVKVPQGTTLRIGEPSEVPEPLSHSLKACLKKQKGVKKAYLKWMVKGEEQSYLLIVDFEGSQAELFRDIAQAASPYLNGSLLDITDSKGWAAEHLRDAEPFYKKKRFGFI
ncbi:enhanced serine sensitivity protein SseB [Paenibacillus sp. FSL H7-0326]|uniref:enhanced serine sensitivity protein SseB n=1 Tax=Paenibacillus sp. FSL H7-0326 TaxID=1921144 RepID=UPI0015C2FB43|nr:enhanced serine sensitivity protein SseB [Paenibacillus sp. FSL H7-0326]